MRAEAEHHSNSPEADLTVLGSARQLVELPSDSTGQLAVEWVLIMAVILPALAGIFYVVWDMIPRYFYRTAEVICLPFP